LPVSLLFLMTMDDRLETNDGASHLQIVPELPTPCRVPQLTERLGLDLADALTGHTQVLADLFQRVILPVLV